MSAEVVELQTYLAAAAKAGLVWVAVAGRPARPLWTVWHEEALHSVVGGAEQPDPFDALPCPVQVTVPSKDTRAGLLRVPMTAVLVPPGTARWVAASNALRMARLNVPFDADLPEVWATDSTVLKLDPAGPVRIADTRDNTAVVVDVTDVRERGWRRMRAHARAPRRREGPDSSLRS